MELSSSSCSIVSIEDMKREYSVCLAKLHLIEKFPDLEFSASSSGIIGGGGGGVAVGGSKLSAQDCISLFTRCGMFDSAFSLALQHELPLMNIFEALASRAAKTIIQHDGR